MYLCPCTEARQNKLKTKQISKNITFSDNGSDPGCSANPAIQLRDEFASPGYDGYTPYPSNANCSWEWTASRLHKVMFLVDQKSRSFHSI